MPADSRESHCQCVICRPRRASHGALPALAQHVKETGWAAMHISGQPGWHFTIGRWHTDRVPEIATFGFPKELGHALLTDLHAQPPPQDGDRRELGMKRSAVAFRRVHSDWYPALLGTLSRFYGGLEPGLAIPVLQMLWVDPKGKYPWEEHYAYPGLQPFAWLPLEQAPQDDWVRFANATKPS